MKPVCTEATPAPPGKPLYDGAVAAKWADEAWLHPNIRAEVYVSSGGVFHDDRFAKTAFQPSAVYKCVHCGGQLPGDPKVHVVSVPDYSPEDLEAASRIEPNLETGGKSLVIDIVHKDRAT